MQKKHIFGKNVNHIRIKVTKRHTQKLFTFLYVGLLSSRLIPPSYNEMGIGMKKLFIHFFSFQLNSGRVFFCAMAVEEGQ